MVYLKKSFRLQGLLSAHENFSSFIINLNNSFLFYFSLAELYLHGRKNRGQGGGGGGQATHMRCFLTTALLEVFFQLYL